MKAVGEKVVLVNYFKGSSGPIKIDVADRKRDGFATILSIGPDVPSNRVYKEGDRVVVAQMSGQSIDYKDESYLIVHHRDLSAIVDKE